METNTSPYNVSIDYWREQNAPYKSEWLFPVRVAAKDRIQWYPNLTEAFAVMKRPLDYVGWQNLLRQKRICAYDQTDTEKLEAWWDIGWQQTPQLAPKRSRHANPILRIAASPLGETLELVYPSITIAREELNSQDYLIQKACSGMPVKLPFAGRLHSMREIATVALQELQENLLPWTLFAADNTILGHFRTREELAKATPYSWQQINRRHLNYYNELEDGTWVWYNQWDVMPISPRDEPLGMDWRTKYAPKTMPEGKID